LASVDDAGVPTALEKSPKRAPVWEFLLVLAILAGIALWGTPRLLRKVSDSRIAAMVDLVSELRGGLVRYNADVGTFLPLDPAGQPVVQPASGPRAPWSLGWALTRSVPPSAQGSWEHFHGPYIRGARLEALLLGTAPRLGAGIVGTGSRLVPAPPSFDLTGTGSSSLANGHVVAWLVVSDVARADFEALDARLDGGIGSTAEQKQKLGEVLWSPDNGGTLTVHLLHR
jgi:hypothetical protein